jgi:hypothetical protein
MFEKAKNVSVTNSNFYYTEGNLQMNFQENSYTGDAPADFYRDFGPTLRIPSDEIEGSILFICVMIFLLGLTIPSSEVGESASLDDDRAEESRQPTPNLTSAPISNSFSKCHHFISLLPLLRI